MLLLCAFITLFLIPDGVTLLTTGLRLANQSVDHLAGATQRFLVRSFQMFDQVFDAGVEVVLKPLGRLDESAQGRGWSLCCMSRASSLISTALCSSNKPS